MFEVTYHGMCHCAKTKGSTWESHRPTVYNICPFNLSNIHTIMTCEEGAVGNLLAQQGNFIFLTICKISNYKPDSTTKQLAL